MIVRGLALPVFLSMTLAISAGAQKTGDAGIGIPPHPAGVTTVTNGPDSIRQPVSFRNPAPSRPRWLKAAAIGAIGGGLVSASLHWLNPDSGSFGTDLAIGIVGGAAVAGSSIAFFDWVCGPDSPSANAGLCGHGGGPRVLPGR